MTTEPKMPEALKKYVAYYPNDFGDKYPAFLSDNPKIVESIDCEVYRADDVDAELRRLHEQVAELENKLQGAYDSIREHQQIVKELWRVLETIKQVPQNTMSDGKALREIMQITNKAIDAARSKEQGK